MSCSYISAENIPRFLLHLILQHTAWHIYHTCTKSARFTWASCLELHCPYVSPGASPSPLAQVPPPILSKEEKGLILERLAQSEKFESLCAAKVFACAMTAARFIVFTIVHGCAAQPSQCCLIMEPCGTAHVTMRSCLHCVRPVVRFAVFNSETLRSGGSGIFDSWDEGSVHCLALCVRARHSTGGTGGLQGCKTCQRITRPMHLGGLYRQFQE